MSRWSGVTFEALQGLGVGVAGPQPAEDSGDEVQAAFGRRFTAPVRGDNTRFAALAEALAAGSDARDVLHVRLSDVPGARGMAGGTHAQ